MTAHTYGDTLRHRGLQPFLWTQFLGAFNDNLFKIVVSMLAVHAATKANAGRQLSLVGVVFILPFLLFSGYAGQLADVYSKRTVLVVTKSLEIVAAGLGLFAFMAGHLNLTYVVLFLIALQATFFSPAKYGILPEMLPDRDLSRANGVLEMSTFVAIVAGTAIGSFMFEALRDRLWIIGPDRRRRRRARHGAEPRAFRRSRRRRAGIARSRWNPWREIALGMARLRGNRVLWLTVAGISYFWFLGALLQLLMILFGTRGHGPERSLDGDPDDVRRDRHRDRQHRRGPAVGRQGRARPRADRIDRHGRVRRCCSRSRRTRSRSRR